MRAFIIDVFDGPISDYSKSLSNSGIKRVATYVTVAEDQNDAIKEIIRFTRKPANWISSRTIEYGETWVVWTRST